MRLAEVLDSTSKTFVNSSNSSLYMLDRTIILDCPSIRIGTDHFQVSLCSSLEHFCEFGDISTLWIISVDELLFVNEEPM